MSTQPIGFYLGFPEAEAAKSAAGPKADELKWITLHASDIRFSLDALRHIEEKPVDDILAECVWTASIARFFKCFQNAASRSPLNADLVFATRPDALEVFS